MTVWPVPILDGLHPKISDPFGFSEQRGRLHAGSDIMYPRATRGELELPIFAKLFFMPNDVPALAFSDGVVTRAGTINTGGRVEIDHGNGFVTKYFHLLGISVRQGQSVRAGQPIGLISHNPTGFKLNHLHFEVHRNGVQIDPAPFLRTSTFVSLQSSGKASATRSLLKGAGIGLAIAGGLGIAFLILKKRRDSANLAGAKHLLNAMPDRWWTRKIPGKDKLCYKTKTEALRKFMEWNQGVIDDYGGPTAKGSGGEFDAFSRFDVRPTDIAQALWVSLPCPPRGRPFCLEDIDVDTLNETSPGQDHPVGFKLPDYVVEADLIEQEYEHYRSLT